MVSAVSQAYRLPGSNPNTRQGYMEVLDTEGNKALAMLVASADPATGVVTKLPALGTAGTASTDVITVQGIAGGTAVMVGGAVASGATDSGNPVKSAGVYNSTQPTFTTGQRGDMQIGARGSLRVEIFGSGTTTGSTVTNFSADAASSNGSLCAASFNGVYNGSTWDRARGDTNGIVQQPYAMTGSRWGYAAAASGISNTTTAVPIAAAAGASVRNYVTSAQYDFDALGAATEIAIRDGAGGAVLWRGKIPAGAAGMREIVFPAPLKGTANTLLEVVTLTASVTGAVFFNAQGLTGA